MTSATYDAANQIATWGGTGFTYDPNGSLTSDGTTTYTWNVRNQLTGLSGGASASFAYDGFGRRRGKTMSGTSTNFLYDGLNIVQELTSGGTPTANLLTGLGIDEAFTRTDASGTSTLLTDALGSTLALADASGAVQTTYAYEPFGATTSSGASSTNSLQFTGRENDGAGLYFYRARFYSAQLQRFVSEDPLGSDGGLNLFAYAADSPTNLVDPLGLKPSVDPGRQPGRRGGRPRPSGPRPPEARPPAPRPGDRPAEPENKDDKPNPCKGYWQRVLDDFLLTNWPRGWMIYPGLNAGLRSAETIGELLGTPTLSQLLESGLTSITIDGLILTGYTYGGVFFITGIAFETGVAVGSMVRAGFEGCH